MTSPIETLIEKDQIISTINQLFIATDSRDWANVKDCFTDQVLFDMTSVTGGTAVRISPEQIATGWEEGLRPIEAIHHQAGNYRVDIRGDQANAFCYGMASHYRRTSSGRNTRTFVGSYDFHLRRTEGRWRIDRFRFNLKYVDGNPDLEKS
jgi:SnoaL-like protein